MTKEEFGDWLVHDQTWEIMVVTKVIGSEYVNNRFVVYVLAVPEDSTLGLGESQQVIKFESYGEVSVGEIFLGFT
jgi:hypothetical protein